MILRMSCSWELSHWCFAFEHIQGMFSARTHTHTHTHTHTDILITQLQRNSPEKDSCQARNCRERHSRARGESDVRRRKRKRRRKMRKVLEILLQCSLWLWSGSAWLLFAVLAALRTDQLLKRRPSFSTFPAAIKSRV